MMARHLGSSGGGTLLDDGLIDGDEEVATELPRERCCCCTCESGNEEMTFSVVGVTGLDVDAEEDVGGTDCL